MKITLNKRFPISISLHKKDWEQDGDWSYNGVKEFLIIGACVVTAKRNLVHLPFHRHSVPCLKGLRQIHDMDSSLSNHTKSPTSDYNYGILPKVSGDAAHAGSGDSIKLKISTKLADGSRAITNHSIPLNHNNVPKVKESHKDSSSSKHSHKNDINDKYKDPNAKLKDGHKSSSGDKVKENHKIKDEKHKSDKHRDEKRKEDRHKDSKHDKHKDDRHKSDKHKSDKHKEDKHKSGLPNSSSSSTTHSSSSSSKPKESSSSSSSSKPKENHSHSSSHKDSKHKEGSSSKIRDESKHKEHKEHKLSSSSSIMKPKEGSNEISNNQKVKESSSKPKDSNSLSSLKVNSSGERISSSKHPEGEKKMSSSSGEKKEIKVEKKEHKSEKRDKDEKKLDGEKHKNSSSSGEKHRDKDIIKKHKEKENRDKVNESNEHKHKETKMKIKEEFKDSSLSAMKMASPVKIKEEPPSDDDLPLSNRKSHDKKKSEDKKIMKENLNNKHKDKRKKGSDDESDDEPLSSRMNKVKKIKSESKFDKKRKADEYFDEPMKKKKKPPTAAVKVEMTSPKKGRAKKEEEQQDVWKWWEEEKYEGGVKWRNLEHKGPVFAPAYDPLPPDIPFYYDGKEMKLSLETEEVATFYGKMLDHDYTTKDAFNKNFFKDWRKVMTPAEKEKITDLKKCNFAKINDYFKMKSEERKSMTKEEKAFLKRQNEDITKEYGFCVIDGHKEKIGNFKIEPPGLFRGRGEHPKMGMLKRRIMPADVIINCGKGSNIPKAPEGYKWKEVRHDNTVTWLACWTENVQGQTKYVMLNASSKLKGEKDWQKYETARRLKSSVDTIRENYREDWRSKEMKIRQRAVALYFIDKLALRAGNEKEEGETADTVGCCSLRVEHIQLHEQKGNQQYVVDFDFLGKDSIRYLNSVPVEKRVFKNLQLFMDNKQPEDDLFDRLNTAILNKHLNELMEGLTAKVFRTFNASKTLQEQLDALTKPDDTIPEKILSYNRANRAVAILCNHQRAVPKTFDKSMENLQTKINAKREQVEECEMELEKLNKSLKKHHSEKEKILRDRKKKALERLKDQLTKLEVQATDKEENKEIALGTSKLNYLDPRISVAWCKKWNVPIEKIYNKTQRDKFRWAIEMAGPDFKF